MRLLTGKFTRQSTFPEGDIRRDWPNGQSFQESLEKVEDLRTLDTSDQSLGKLGLRFVLSRPAVAVAIPGAKTPEQVAEKAAASRRLLLTEEERERVDQVTMASV